MGGRFHEFKIRGGVVGCFHPLLLFQQLGGIITYFFHISFHHIDVKQPSFTKHGTNTIMHFFSPPFCWPRSPPPSSFDF
eukprot:NODE_634_length_697_cov_275.464912_g625_i0.p1 GENE.NODE_634_length_697_cov_275.464912_g625_i0~~NODE_634_length_697_cov_275.464912_g625_i0.p1  ORF type:complete len:79 (-),score=23.23 NODE_634_length_697_cov_275.464912_g625_i0:283-519(-)